ncbi:MAG: ATP-binding domain-containing protein, partial [Rhodoferax sp.]|nr:ATP-binding domain-containing protein [Rhodoferax sp.]
SLHAFGRELGDLAERARQAEGAEAARALLLAWLTEIGYEQHLHDGADSQALAVARWTNVIDFVDWIARRCEADDDAGRGRGNVLQVAQTINVILSLAERGDDADVVTLSTLHAAKGLEWPHVVLAGVVEGLLPFRADGEALSAERLHEERRLMYVGITRAQRTLLVSTLRRRKRGRETVPAQPSRFVAEMKLDAAVVKDDPRERLKRLRAELAARVPSEETPS